MRDGIARIAARVLPLALCVGAVSCGTEVPLVGEQAAAGVVSSAVNGAIALGAYTYRSDVANQGTSPMTTSAINTHASGSTFVLFVGTANVNGTSSFGSVGDNMGNTYTRVGSAQSYGNGKGQLRTYICTNCKGGSGHAFSLTKAGTLSSAEAVLFAVEATGAPNLDAFAQANATRSPLSAGTVATTQTGDMLLLCALGASSSSPDLYTPSAGFTLLNEQTNGTSSLAGADAWAVAGAPGSYGGTLKSSLATSGAVFLLALSPPPLYGISGTVSGAPAGVAMTLSGAASASTTTAADGSYSFGNLLSGGLYQVTPSLAGYDFYPPSLEVMLSGPRNGQSFTGHPTCTANHWCWQGPVPRAPDANAVWANTTTDVWVVGDGGSPMHWDGTSWTN